MNFLSVCAVIKETKFRHVSHWWVRLTSGLTFCLMNADVNWPLLTVFQTRKIWTWTPFWVNWVSLSLSARRPSTDSRSICRSKRKIRPKASRDTGGHRRSPAASSASRFSARPRVSSARAAMAPAPTVRTMTRPSRTTCPCCPGRAPPPAAAVADARTPHQNLVDSDLASLKYVQWFLIWFVLVLINLCADGWGQPGKGWEN